jgi:exopolyphosphatase/guanosine-5'-triphosphate,3'-diphosphate pyrophosphatase
VPGLQPERADIIIGGAAIVQNVMESVGADSIYISEQGLREGIVVDFINRQNARQQTYLTDMEDIGILDDSVRGKSINRLARRTQIDLVHSGHIVKLSIDLFEQTFTLGLHNYSEYARELLRNGALLHDCGFFISHNSHQQHSYYIIRHSELLGFNDVEIEVMAQIALYHRKGLPKDKHDAFGSLPDAERHMVRVLSCFVRLAEAMDRSHLNMIKSVRLSRSDNPSHDLKMSFDLADNCDPALELWAVQGQLDAFNRTFGKTVQIDGLDNFIEQIPSPL